MSVKQSTVDNRFGLIVGVVALAVTLLAAAQLLGDNSLPGSDWPQWMGPRLDGSSPAEGVFGEGEIRLDEVWRKAAGSGYSSLAIAGGKTYLLTTAGGEKPKDFLVAYEAASGKELWRQEIGPVYLGHDGSHDGSIATPTVANGRVFVLTPFGKLHAFDAITGKPAWSKDLVQEFKAEEPFYGIGTSPVADGDQLLVLLGGEGGHNLVALDQASGAVRWSVNHAERTSYATPVPATLAGVRQIVVPAGDKLYSIDAKNGALLWSFEGSPNRSPVIVPGDRILLPQGNATVMLQVEKAAKAEPPEVGGDSDQGAEGAEGAKGEPGLVVQELWSSPRMKQSWSPVIYHEGAVYGFNAGILTCLDAKTGELKWRERIFEGSLILVDGHLVVLGLKSGKLHIVKATPEGFQQRLETKVFNPGAASYSPPSFAEGKIFLRNLEEVVALKVGGA
jgi:outer membrane protein assembly factor BamB